jgi:hypothetical protein
MVLFVKCPHCECEVEIVELNCRIFRHRVFKESGAQVNPHAPKAECDELFEKNMIYGCGKPFQIIQDSDGFKAIQCDYI